MLEELQWRPLYPLTFRLDRKTTLLPVFVNRIFAGYIDIAHFIDVFYKSMIWKIMKNTL